jgi:hypothetical protein
MMKMTNHGRTAFLGLLISFWNHAAFAEEASDAKAQLGSYQKTPREWVTKDRWGNTLGTVREETWGAKTTDRWGNWTGYVIEQPNGVRAEYDRSGSRVGTVERR